MDGKLEAVLVLGMLTSISGWRPYTVKFLSVTQNILHPELMDLNITLKNQSVLNAHLNVGRDIVQLFMDLEVTADSGGGTYDMVYMNKTVDLCSFLKNRKSNPLLDIIYKIVTSYGELPKTCPIQKKLYTLLNIFIDPEMFPPFIPDHKSRVMGTLWNKDKDKKVIFMIVKLYVMFERSYKNNAK